MSKVPLAESEQFCTGDLDVIRVLGSEVLVPHRVEAIGPVCPTARMNAAKFGSTTLAYMDYGSSMRLTAPTIEGAFFFTVPLVGKAEARRGSREVAPSIPGKGASYASDEWAQLTLGPGYKQFAVGIERQGLERRLEGLLGHEITAPLRFQMSLDLQSPALQTWVDSVGLLRAELERSTKAETEPLLSARIEDLVMTGLLVGQPHNYSEMLRLATQPCRPRTVKLAIQLMEQQPDQPWSLSELARAAGVSARTLQDAFHRYVGMSPTGYLRGVRLERVHAELTAATGHISVTEVAYRWGFSHLGRFAVAYRRRFGESPSQTAQGAAPRVLASFHGLDVA
jgi:AraC-like DNA-binding protein